MSKRLEYIDVMRGIAILLVIFEHCIGSLEDFSARFILSFHMPLFFFISGSLLKPLGGGICDYKSLLKKKVRTILLPQITLAVLNITVIVIFDVFLKHKLRLYEVDFITPFGNWFLITLFLMEIIAVPLITFIKNRGTLSLVTLAVFFIFCCVTYTDVMYIQQTLAALVFGLTGYLCKPLLDIYSENKYKYSGLGWIILLITALCSMFNEPIGMYINQYGNKFLFVIIAALGICSLLDISVSLKNTGFIQWCGRLSIILYILHPVIIKVVTYLSSICFSSFEYYRYPCYVFTFLAVIVILIPLTYFCNRYLKFAFGK